MGLGGVATAALPSVVRLQMVFSDRLGGGKSALYSFLYAPDKGPKYLF